MALSYNDGCVCLLLLLGLKPLLDGVFHLFFLLLLLGFFFLLLLEFIGGSGGVYKWSECFDFLDFLAIFIDIILGRWRWLRRVAGGDISVIKVQATLGAGVLYYSRFIPAS